jgi:hypothetical protein
MDVSIYNAIRSSKVNTGNVWQYQGMRTFDSSAQVCPARANVSDTGVVGVARDSIQSYAPGCFSALDRMTVESMQRPHYSSYLNASAINAPGVGDNAVSISDYQIMKSQPYDTMFGNSITTRPVLSRSAMLTRDSMKKLKSTMAPPRNAQEAEARFVDCTVSSVYDQGGCDSSARGRFPPSKLTSYGPRTFSSGGYGGYAGPRD